MLTATVGGLGAAVVVAAKGTVVHILLRVDLCGWQLGELAVDHRSLPLEVILGSFQSLLLFFNLSVLHSVCNLSEAVGSLLLGLEALGLRVLHSLKVVHLAPHLFGTLGETSGQNKQSSHL